MTPKYAILDQIKYITATNKRRNMYYNFINIRINCSIIITNFISSTSISCAWD